MGQISVIDRKAGDIKVEWDPNKPDEVKHARKTFDEWLAKGYLAYSVVGTERKGDVIRRFDPYAEKIILAPRVAGG